MKIEKLLNKKIYISFILMLVIFTGMRSVFINADPPQDLSISAAIYTDEGFKTYASRNLYLYGNVKWAHEDAYSGWSKRSPVSTWTFYYIFKMWGRPCLASVRLVSVLYALITMIALFFITRRIFDQRHSLLALALFGLGFFNAMFGRLGLYESHLNLYFLVSFFFLLEAGRFTGNDRKIYRYSCSIIAVCLGLGLLLVSYFVKSSLYIAVLAVLPAIVLITVDKLRPVLKLKIFGLMLAFLVLGYLIAAHTLPFLGSLNKSLLDISFFNTNLASLVHSKLFDIFPVMFAKALYLEFVFLQPVTFFLSIFYSIYTFYNFVMDKYKNKTDLLLASWFLFGFILLTLLSYHPARYYVILIVPMVFLTARAILNLNGNVIKKFLLEKKPVSVHILLKTFYGLSFVYFLLSMVILFVPLKVRNILVGKVYSGVISDNIPGVLIYVIPMVCIIILLLLVLIKKRKRIQQVILNSKGMYGVLALILALQFFQYSKWFFFHDYRQYNLSRKLGSMLPENAVIAGGWSAGLVVENNLRALILQDKSQYNHILLKDLVETNNILTNNHDGTTRWLKNVPVYLAICPNVVFERHILASFAEYIDNKSLVLEETFGFFNIKLYKLTRKNSL